jgi:5-formyltetrahydrofolate cyclo-ligase
MRLKSWESPRSEGRNSKGKGGSARARQLKKQQQTLRKQLKAQNAQLNDRPIDRPNNKPNNKLNNQGKETNISFPYFFGFYSFPVDVRTNSAIEQIERRLLLPAVENSLQRIADLNLDSGFLGCTS